MIKTKLNTALFMLFLAIVGRCSFSPKRVWLSIVLCCAADPYEFMISDISFLQMLCNGQNRRKCSTLLLLSPHLQSGEDVS